MAQEYQLGSKLISNTFFISLEWIATTIFSFLFWLIIGKNLLPTDYGIVSVFVNFTVILGAVLTLGTSIALFKLIPEYIGLKQLGKITSSIRFTLRLLLITSIISTIIIFSLSGMISTLFKIPNYLVWLLPLSLLIFALYTHQAEIILGFQNAKRFAITSVIGQIVKVIVTGVLIFTNKGFLGPIIGFITGSFLIFITRINYLLYNKPQIRIDGKGLIKNFGIPALLSKLLTILLINGSPLILALFHTTEAVGILGIAMLLTNQLSVIPSIFSTALFPLTSLLSISKQMEKIQARLITLILRYALLITIPFLTFITLFSGKLIMLVSQFSYLPATSLIPILAVGALFLGTSYIFTNSLYAIGRPDIQRNLLILTSVIYTILAFPLSYLFSGLGISISYTVSTFVLTIASFIYLKKILPFTIPLKNTSKLIFANIVTFSILFILSNFASNIIIGILYTCLAGIVYLFLLLVLRFYTNDDVRLLGTMAKHLPVASALLRTLSNIMSQFVEK